MIHTVKYFGLLLICSVAACTQSAPPPAAPPPAPIATPTPPPATAGDPATEAKQIFATRCTPCHGATGLGDGAASASLTPKPANFGSAQWQASVTDDHIEKIIAYGGMAVGKSAAMPPNPDLDGKPVVPALRVLIRGMKQ